MKTVAKITGAVLLILAIGVALLGYYIGTNCTGREPVNLTPLPDPMETVTTFFDSVCAEDYSAAYECLSGYDTLGLENIPEDTYAAAFWKIVRSNTSWEALSGTVNGTEASMQVSVISPDLNQLVEGLGDDVNARIEERVEEAATTDGIYDEENNFLQEFVLEVYDEVLTERLKQASYPTMTTTVTVYLIYTDSVWKIVPDTELMNALTGGAV